MRDGDVKYVRREQGSDVKEWLFDLSVDVAAQNHLILVRPADVILLKHRLAEWEEEVRPNR